MVAGYHARSICRWAKLLGLDVIENRAYAETNNAYSTYLAYEAVPVQLDPASLVACRRWFVLSRRSGFCTWLAVGVGAEGVPSKDACLTIAALRVLPWVAERPTAEQAVMEILGR